jgi:hypothetical protein
MHAEYNQHIARQAQYWRAGISANGITAMEKQAGVVRRVIDPAPLVERQDMRLVVSVAGQKVNRLGNQSTLGAFVPQAMGCRQHIARADQRTGAKSADPGVNRAYSAPQIIAGIDDLSVVLTLDARQ